MGNQPTNQINITKLKQKAYRQRLKKYELSRDCIFQIDKNGLIVYYTKRILQTFHILDDDRVMKEKYFRTLCPKVQPHLNKPSNELIIQYSKEVLTKEEGYLDLLWCFYVPKNKTTKTKKKKNKEKEKKKERERERERKKKKKPKKKRKSSKKNKRAIWSFINVSAILVQDEIIYELQVRATFKPIDLLKQRRLIQKMEQKICNVKKRIKQLREHSLNSPMGIETTKVQMEIRELISTINNSLEKNTNLKKECKLICEQMENRDFQKHTEEFAKEKKLITNRVIDKEKKLRFHLKQERNKSTSEKLVNHLERTKKQILNKKNDQAHLKKEMNEVSTVLPENAKQLKTLREQNIVKLERSDQLQRILNEKTQVENQLDAVRSKSTKTLNRMKENAFEKKIAEQISQYHNQIKKLTQIQNHYKYEIERLKSEIKTSNSLSSSFYFSEDSGDDSDFWRVIDNEESSDFEKQEFQNFVLVPEMDIKVNIDKKTPDSQKFRRKSIFSFVENSPTNESVRSSILPLREKFNLSISRSKSKLKKASSDFNLKLEKQDYSNDSSKKNTKEQGNVTLIKDVSPIKTFQDLLKCQIAIEYFREYLSERMVVEPLLFYLDWLDFKKSFTEENQDELIAYFVDNYIENTSIFALSIEDDLREEIMDTWDNGDATVNIFDELGKNIFQLVSTKYFEQFKKSYVFNELINLESYKNNIFTRRSHFETEISSEDKEMITLNSGIQFKGKCDDPYKLSLQLLEQLLDILNANYSFTLGSINCEKIEQSIPFKAFLVKSSELQKIHLNQITQLGEDKKRAFFINIYNVISTHSIIINEFIKRNSLQSFLVNSCYDIGGQIFSLEKIKSQIFGLIPYETKQFNMSTQYSTLKLKNVDPRIHFTLISPTLKTPILQIYYHETINEKLTESTCTFLKKYISIDHQNKIVYLSNVFVNYYTNFGLTQSQILLWIRNFLQFNDILGVYSYSFRTEKFQLENVLKFITENYKKI
ncbi:electron carrier/ protein disulfide oxidoreductase [Anaeramoeba flamelloides]|uniref:Electron carrier/ protein disulfide oxidoreductase n=1 Tax=Anaeramoeba flamelloides TaxID=1746091 RepID=A0AAV7YC98_9EUKA|nr:electron carrier/ protein disulfide oxidoreductase [Anaeramoeba flamelloides]